MAESRRELRFHELAPGRWFKSPSTSSLWLAAFRMGNVLEANFNGQARLFELPEVVGLVTFGELRYVDASAVRLRFEEPGVMRISGSPVDNAVAHGAWLTFLTPLDVDGRRGNEADARQRISSAAALFAVFLGRNAVFEHVFDNVVSADGERTSAASPVVENPGVFPRPDLTDKRFHVLTQAVAALVAVPSATRMRIQLALHWYEQALRSEGSDAFLKTWIALEVLAMPNSTNIRPINEALAAAYQLHLDEATHRFQVGRLFNLRSRIVHAGELVRLHYLLECYLQAIFSDVLCELLKIPTQGDLEALLHARGAEIDPFLKQ